MNSKTTEYPVYHNTEIEQYIHERHISIQNEFITLAHNLGEKNKPETFPAWESIKQAIHAKYDVLYTYVCKRLQGKATQKLGEADLAQGKLESQNLDHRIAETTEKARTLGIDIERIKLTYHWGMYWFLLVLLAIIFLSDSYYNQKAFAAMGDNFLVTIVLSLGISATLWAIAHFLVKFIQQIGKTVFQRRLLTIVCVAFLSLVFLALGYLRTYYFKQEGDSFISNSPYMFMLINLFLLGGSMLITFFAMPTQQQRLEKKAKDDKIEKLAQLNAELVQLRNLKDQSVNGTASNMKDNLLIISYQEELLSNIEALCKETEKSFQMENTLKRVDPFPQEQTVQYLH
jgi:TRAP-type C4-dicarboxylate transport system permease small subunit